MQVYKGKRIKNSSEWEKKLKGEEYHLTTLHAGGSPGGGQNNLRISASLRISCEISSTERVIQFMDRSKRV